MLATFVTINSNIITLIMTVIIVTFLILLLSLSLFSLFSSSSSYLSQLVVIHYVLWSHYVPKAYALFFFSSKRVNLRLFFNKSLDCVFSFILVYSYYILKIIYQAYGMPPCWIPCITEIIYTPLPYDWNGYFLWRGKPPMALAETTLITDILSIPLTIVNFIEWFVFLLLCCCVLSMPDTFLSYVDESIIMRVIYVTIQIHFSEESIPVMR